MARDAGPRELRRGRDVRRACRDRRTGVEGGARDLRRSPPPRAGAAGRRHRHRPGALGIVQPLPRRRPRPLVADRGAALEAPARSRSTPPGLEGPARGDRGRHQGRDRSVPRGRRPRPPRGVRRGRAARGAWLPPLSVPQPDDEYPLRRVGGPIDGRARLVREAVRAVRSAVPKRFLVGVRLSPEDFGNAKGLDLDESIEVARWLCADGADFIHLSLWDSTRNTRKRPDEHAVPSFRAALPSEVPIVVAGNIWTRAEAEKLLERGASAVAIEWRAAIANPAWPAHVVEPHVGAAAGRRSPSRSSASAA